MKNEFVFLISFFVICLMFWYASPNKQPQIDNTFSKIDTIYQDRISYRTDTVTKYKTKILKVYDTAYKYTDSVFEFGTDSQKIANFNYHYPIVDTTKLMIVTTNQAKDAIVTKESYLRDSSLLDLQNKNVANCDAAFDSLKEQTDSLKNILPKRNYWKPATYILGTVAVISLSINLGGLVW